MTRYVVLVFLWLTWCFMHSLLISPPVTGFLHERFRKAYRFYRIFYNIVAVVTLIPVLLYTVSIQGTAVFSWEGALQIVPVLLLISALLLFVGGARCYDLRQFLGIRHVHANKACSVLTDDCRLNTRGVLGMVRHPWYTGGILLVWTRNLDVSAILTNLVITGYFVVGAFLEEKKLVAQFGQEYTAYQQRVSMFFPIKWARKKLLGR